MNRTSFLARLRSGLAGLPPQQIDDIVADYEAHFSEGAAAGRSEDSVADALGDPDRLAKELRAEAGIRRWETDRNAGNFIGALFALLGLATLDVMFLLPLLCVGAVLAFVLGLVAAVVAFVGAIVLASAAWGGLFFAGGWALARALTGMGLLAGGVGGGALLLLMIDALMRLLGRYARLHYRLLNPSDNPA
jgi:uncharacterized membrane protein